MKKPILFLSLLVVAGGVGAETLKTEDPVIIAIRHLQDKVLMEFQLIQSLTGLVGDQQKLLLHGDGCPSGWQDSEYNLIDNSGNKPDEDLKDSNGKIVGFRFHDDKKIPIQVCHDSGILRIKPK